MPVTGWCIRLHTISAWSNKSLPECQNICRLNNNCRSYSFDWRPQDGDEDNCFISNVFAVEAGENYQLCEDYTYSEKYCRKFF